MYAMALLNDSPLNQSYPIVVLAAIEKDLNQCFGHK